MYMKQNIKTAEGICFDGIAKQKVRPEAVEIVRDHQTSDQPPSSSLYEASLSGRSGLSTSLATRSSARPLEFVWLVGILQVADNMETFSKEHPRRRGVRQYVSTDWL